MVDIITGGAHYQALEYINEQGGNVPMQELSALERELDFKTGILTILGYTTIEKEMVYLTVKGRKKLEKN